MTAGEKDSIMKWEQIRTYYPQKWLLVEAIKAHSEQDQRILDDLSVINTFADSVAAMQDYAKLHRDEPERELYVLNTERETLNIKERYWLGVRGAS